MKQLSLMDIDKDWEKEWQDMPEFTMQHIKPIRKILIQFKTEEDIKKFEKLLGQKITNYNTYWFPKLNFKVTSKKVFVDES